MASRKKRSVSRKPEEQKRMKTVSNGQSVAQLQDIGSLSVPKRGRGRNVVKKELHEGDFLQQETEVFGFCDLLQQYAFPILTWRDSEKLLCYLQTVLHLCNSIETSCE